MTELLNNSNLQLPKYLQDSILFSDNIHMVQLTDIFGKKFNHLTFIGKYSEIINKQEDFMCKENKVITSKALLLFLEEKIDDTTVKPNHSIFYYTYDVVNFNEILYGMIKCNDYYILVNTKDESLKYNVYATTKDKTKSGIEYYCLAFIGKIVNPAPYIADEIDLFEQINNIKLSEKLKTHLTKNPKICGINNENIRKLFYVNIFDQMKVNIKSTKVHLDSFDLEYFRKPLNEIMNKTMTDKNYNYKEDENYNKLIQAYDIEHNNLKNGFIEIGVILDETHKNKENGFDTQIKLYMAVNCDEDYQGTLWVNNFEDSIDYIPKQNMLKIGSIC